MGAAAFALFGSLTAGAAVADATFSDPAGDQIDVAELVGPDITAIEVTNTRSGAVTFRVVIGNFQTLPAHSLVSVLFDLDKNGATGDQGFENAITHEIDPAGQPKVAFERYDEAQFALVEVPVTNVSGSFSAGILTVTVPRAELQNTTTFEFGVFAVVFDEDESDVAGDVAPDQGLLTYDLLGLPPPRLQASALVVSPKRPVAGRPFSVRAVVTRADTGTVVRTGVVACTIRLGSARLRAQSGFRARNAHCTVSVPATAKGKRLTGSLTVRTAGATVTKRFAFQVV